MPESLAQSAGRKDDHNSTARFREGKTQADQKEKCVLHGHILRLDAKIDTI